MPYPVAAARGGKETAAAAVAGSSLLTDLVHYWTLNEASGTRYDSVGNLDLTPSASDPASVAGVQGNCADMEQASSEYLGSTTKLQWASDWTIAFWFNAESIPTTPNYHGVMIQGFGFGYGGGIAIKLSGSPQMAGLLSSGVGAEQVICHADIPDAGNWCLVLFTNDYATKTFRAWSYSTGSLVNNSTETYAWNIGANNTWDFSLGFTQGSTAHWDGMLDEFGIWSRVLTTDEMDELYGGGSGWTP